MMIKDNTDANINLKSVADQLDIILGDSLSSVHEHHKMILSAKKDAAFDKAYITMMVNDHYDIAAFEKAARSSNPRIRHFAAQTLPVLIKHLDPANAIMAGIIR